MIAAVNGMGQCRVAAEYMVPAHSESRREQPAHFPNAA